MKQNKMIYLICSCCVVMSLLAVSLLLCSNENVYSKNTSLVEGFRGIPICEPAIPENLKEQSEVKLSKFLEFFKAPEKQFMPLGLYAMKYDMRNVEKLKSFRRQGIVLFHKYHSEQSVASARLDLEAAQKAGAPVLQNLPSKYFKTRNEAYRRSHIKALADNRQIIAWYLPEETKWKDLDNLKKLSDMVRDIDKEGRPTLTYSRHEPDAYLSRVGGIVDAVIFGYYPGYYTGGIRINIKKRMDKAYRSGVPIVIAALEAFKTKRGWTRPEHIRFDAYLALISGAKGIMWYNYDQAKQRPKLLEAILKTSNELNGPESIGEVLLLGEEPDHIKCGVRLIVGRVIDQARYESMIQWTAREYKGFLYVFVANALEGNGIVDGSEKSCQVKFGPIVNTSSEIRVIGEERTIQISDSHFVDILPSLGVNVYKIDCSQ